MEHSSLSQSLKSGQRIHSPTSGRRESGGKGKQKYIVGFKARDSEKLKWNKTSGSNVLKNYSRSGNTATIEGNSSSSIGGGSISARGGHMYESRERGTTLPPASVSNQERDSRPKVYSSTSKSKGYRRKAISQNKMGRDSSRSITPLPKPNKKRKTSGSVLGSTSNRRKTTFEDHMRNVVISVEKRKYEKPGRYFSRSPISLSPFGTNKSPLSSSYPAHAIFQNFSNLGNKLQSRKESSGVEDELPHPDEIQIDLGRVKEKDSASRNAVSTLLSSESGHSYSAGRIGKAATEHTTVKHDSERKSRHSKHNSNEKANTGSNIHHVATFMKDSILRKQPFLSLDRQGKHTFTEVKSPEHANVIFTHSGFTSLAQNKYEISDFISNEEYIKQGVYSTMFKNLPFYKNFNKRKFLKIWRNYSSRKNFLRKRAALSERYIFAKPQFAGSYKTLSSNLSRIKKIKYMYLQEYFIYSNHMEERLMHRCNISMQNALLTIVEICLNLKNILILIQSEINAYNSKFAETKKQEKMNKLLHPPKYEDLYNFHKEKQFLDLMKDNEGIVRMRTHMFDKLLNLIYNIILENFISMITTNQHNFSKILLHPKSHPQFIATIRIHEKSYNIDPTLESLEKDFDNLFESFHTELTYSLKVEEFLDFLHQIQYKSRFKEIGLIKIHCPFIISKISGYKEIKRKIMEVIKMDIAAARPFTESLVCTQEIEDFINNWGRDTSTNVSYYMDNWIQISKWKKIIGDIPSEGVEYQRIIIDPRPLKQYLVIAPKQLFNTILSMLQTRMEEEVMNVKKELMTLYKSLDQIPNTLNVYIDQVNSAKYLEEKTHHFTDRIEQTENLASLCKEEKINIPLSVEMQVKDLSPLFIELKNLCKVSQKRIKENKGNMEKIIQSSSSMLSLKIKGFEDKYRSTYLSDKVKLNDTRTTLEELEKRASAISEIYNKVLVYNDFLTILNTDLTEETDKDKEPDESRLSIHCMEDYKRVSKLHSQTMTLWNIIHYWRIHQLECYNTPFVQLKIEKVLTVINKVNNFFDRRLVDFELINKESIQLCDIILNEMQDILAILDFSKSLRKKSIRTRHWMSIVALIQKPNFMNMTFTLIDLKNSKIQRFHTQINEILAQADSELGFEKMVEKIENEVGEMRLKLEPFEQIANTYILVDYEIIGGLIEDYIIMLEGAEENVHALYVKREIKELLDTLQIMQKVFQKWVEAQRKWLYLQPIFGNESLQDFLPKDFEQFKTTEQIYYNIMQAAYKNPRAKANLTLKMRHQIFEEIIGYLERIHKSVDEYLETKRLSFPRFFFLSNTQFLMLLSLLSSRKDVRAYLPSLFPGVQNLLLSGGIVSNTLPVPPFPEEEDPKPGYVTGGNITDLHLNSRQIEGPPEVSHVFGLISDYEELLPFQSPVEMGNRAGEVWMQEVERQMQTTIVQLINYAIASFPVQALDEWILDYPQQVILTTIHLILTHEISELFDNKIAEQEAEEEEEGNRGHRGDNQRHSNRHIKVQEEGKVDIGGSNNLGVMSVQNSILDDTDLDLAEEYRVKINKLDVEYAGQHEHVLTTEQKEEKERKLFIHNLFGNDINATFFTGVQKDSLMEQLQEKSLRGLYLRLLFWIQQISKNLLCPRENSEFSQVFRLTGSRKMIVRSIVVMLIGMRDMVTELEYKSISTHDAYDWEKHIRMNWNAEDNSCKVECGGFGLWQHNEYIGPRQRLYITPNTERYFVFISAALREKSGVLFKCIPAQEYGGIIFEEFAGICTTALQSFQCNEQLSMRVLMQILNGAALGSVWVLFEHINRLLPLILQTLNKEIQMVQQQFIIAELAADNTREEAEEDPKDPQQGAALPSVKGKSSKILSNVNTMSLSKRAFNGSGSAGWKSVVEQEEGKIPNLQASGLLMSEAGESKIKVSSHLMHIESRTPREVIKSFERGEHTTNKREEESEHSLKEEEHKTCFGVYATASGIYDPVYPNSWYDENCLNQMKGAFRLMTLVKPDLDFILQVLLKGLGFEHVRYFGSKIGEFFKHLQSYIHIPLNYSIQDLHALLKIAEAKRYVLMKKQHVSTPIHEKRITNMKNEEISDPFSTPQDSSKILEMERICISESLMLFCGRRYTEEWHMAISSQKYVEPYEISSRFTKPLGEALTLSLSQALNFYIDPEKKMLEEAEREGPLRGIVSSACEPLNVSPTAELMNKVLELSEMMEVTRGICVVGETHTGKSTLLQVLATYIYKLKGRVLRKIVSSLQLFSTHEMFGVPKSNSRGVFEVLVKELGNAITSTPTYPLLVFDSFLDMRTADFILPFLHSANLAHNLNSDIVANTKINKSSKSRLILPNGKILKVPNQLLIVFECLDLRNASPIFVSKVRIIHTPVYMITMDALFQSGKDNLMLKNADLFKVHDIPSDTFIQVVDDIIIPIFGMLNKEESIRCDDWYHAKSAVINCFKLLNFQLGELNSLLNGLGEGMQENANEILKYKSGVELIATAFAIISLTWSTNSSLSAKCQEVFTGIVRKHGRVLAMDLPQVPLLSLYFDLPSLKFLPLEDNETHSISPYYDKAHSTLVFPCLQICQVLYLTHLAFATPDHLLCLGEMDAMKTVSTRAFAISRGQVDYTCKFIGASGWLHINTLREFIETYYDGRRKNILTPKGWKKMVFIVDDLHLAHKVNPQLLEFLRIWNNTKTYFDTANMVLKSVVDFRLLLTYRPDYLSRSGSTKDNSSGLDSMGEQRRFLSHVHKLQLSSLNQTCYKTYIAQWLTSKLWESNVLLNKYYILITTTLMKVGEYLGKLEPVRNTQYHRLNSFQHIWSVIKSLVFFTQKVEVKGNVLEVDSFVCKMLVYEVNRCITDRVLVPKWREEMEERIRNIAEREFMVKDLGPSSRYLFGAYLLLSKGSQEKSKSVYNITYADVSNEGDNIRKKLVNLIESDSVNSYLQNYLYSPSAIAQVWKISRVLCGESSHAILLGAEGRGKREYLQLASILTNTRIIEPNISPILGSPELLTCFTDTILDVVKTARNTVFLLPATHFPSSQYIDLINTFIRSQDEEILILDRDLRERVSRTQEEAEPHSRRAATLFRDNVDPTEGGADYDFWLTSGLKKVRRYLHVVITIPDVQTYRDWIRLYPGLELSSTVICIEELDLEGYKGLTQRWILGREREVEHALLGDSFLANHIVGVSALIMLYFTHTPGSTKPQFIGEDSWLPAILYKKNIFDTDIKDLQLTHLDQRNNNRNQIDLDESMHIGVQYFSRQRYLMFLELFSFFYDMISVGLYCRKNYFESFIGKTMEFKDFFDQVRSKKDKLQNENEELAIKIIKLQEQLKINNRTVEDKNILIQTKRIENLSEDKTYQEIKHELDSVITEKNRILTKQITELEYIDAKEFESLYAGIEVKHLVYEREIRNKKTIKEERKEALDYQFITLMAEVLGDRYISFELLMKKPNLLQLLKQQIDLELTSDIIDKCKTYFSITSEEDFKHRILRCLFIYIFELYKKTIWHDSVSHRFKRLKDIQKRMSSNQLSSIYAEKHIETTTTDITNIENELNLYADQNKSLLKEKQFAEISHNRTKQIVDFILRWASKCEKKLQLINIRAKCLLGDSIIMAATVAYLAPFSCLHRMKIRKAISTKLRTGKILTSDCWEEATNEQIHCAMFSTLLKEQGYKSLITPPRQKVAEKHVLSEILFTLIYSPSCPVITDTMGILEEFLLNTLYSEFDKKIINCSRVGCGMELSQKLASDMFVILKDVGSGGLNYEEVLTGRMAFQGSFGMWEEDRQEISHSWPETLMNTKIPMNKPQSLGCISFFQVSIFTPSNHFPLNLEYLTRATVINANCMSNSDSWIEINEIFYKHFIPDAYEGLNEEYLEIQNLRSKKIRESERFENMFLVAEKEDIMNMGKFDDLRRSAENIKDLTQNYEKKVEIYQNKINEHPLLASYANIFVILYLSLKNYSKITKEITYSWKMYLSIIDLIIGKIIRDLNNMDKEESMSEEEESSVEDSKKDLPTEIRPKKKSNKQREYTINEDFFNNCVMPTIFSVIRASLKQQNAPLLALLFAFQVALKKDTITLNDYNYFFKYFFRVKNALSWNLIHKSFGNMKEQVNTTEYYEIKEDIRLHYEHLMPLISSLEARYEIYNATKYGDIAKHLNENLLSDTPNAFTDLPLIQEINVRLISPDKAFKSKLNKFVFEELRTIFDYNQEFMKFHKFIKTGSWPFAVSLFTHSSINIVNTICSIASYYGVGLEVLRTDTDSLLLDHYEFNRKLHSARKYDFGREEWEDKEKHIAPPNRPEFSVPWDSVYRKDELEMDERQQQQATKVSLQLIKSCAMNGTWVLISTLKFPSFWEKMAAMLREMNEQGQILNSFRVFVDLQGFQMYEIPQSFLYNTSIAFHLNEMNVDDMEGFNDVWANILNSNILKVEESKEGDTIGLMEDYGSILNTKAEIRIEDVNSKLTAIQPTGIPTMREQPTLVLNDSDLVGPILTSPLNPHKKSPAQLGEEIPLMEARQPEIPLDGIFAGEQISGIKYMSNENTLVEDEYNTNRVLLRELGKSEYKKESFKGRKGHI